MRYVRYINVEGGKPPNPIVQALAFLVALAAFVLSVVVGGIVLAALVGFVLLAVIVIYVRVWWLQRKFSAAAGPGGAARGGSENVVEGEYRVIDIKSEDETEPNG